MKSKKSFFFEKNIFSGDLNSPFTWILILIILVTTFLIFSNTLSADFIFNWDDNINITNNPNIHDLSMHGIQKLFDPTEHIDEPRFTLLTYAIEYKYFSLNPYQYHLHNVLLHLLNVLLVFVFAGKILTKGRMALLVALLFAVHPMHVEPVAWITGRKDLLFSLFYLLSLLSYIKHIKKDKGVAWLIPAFIFAFFGLLSKIQMLSIPIVWIALDFYFKRPFKPLLIAEKFFLLIILFFNHFTFPQIVFAFFISSFIAVYPFLRSRIQLKKISIWFHLKLKKRFRILLLLISTLVFIIVFRKINMWNMEIANTTVWLFAFAEVALLLYNYLYYSRKEYMLLMNWKPIYSKLGVGLLVVIFIVMIIFFFLPGMNFWTADFKLIFTPVDRFFMACYSLLFYIFRFFYPFETSPIQPYPLSENGLPLIYYLSAITLIVFSLSVIILKWKKKWKFSASGIFGFIFFLANIILVLHFVSIEGRVIVADRYSYLAYAGLLICIVSLFSGINKIARPKLNVILVSSTAVIIVIFSFYSYFRNRIWNNGITLFTEVISHYPDYELAYANRGTLFLNQQQNKEAIADFNKAISLNDGFDIPYYNRALAYYNMNDFSLAYYDCSRAIACNPLFFDAWYLRGFIKNKWGNYAGAIADYNQTIRLKPDYKLAWYNRGNSKKNLLDYDGALKDYKMTIALDSGFSMAYNAAGVALFFLNDYQGSIFQYDLAIKKNPGEGNYFFNRGLSKLKLNLTDEACQDLSTSWNLGYTDSKSLLEAQCK